MNPRLGYYESYKDHFPKDWEYRKLDKQILDILPGFAFKSEYFSDEKGAPLIRVRDVGKKNTVINYSGDYDKKYLINKNDIIIGMDGNYIIDKWKGPISLLNQRVCKIKSAKNNQLNDDYLYYVIQHPIQKIEKLTPQTTVKHLSTKDIRNIQFPLPPLVEQRGIVEVLGTVDECIRLTDAVIERAEELKRGLMQQLLTRGIRHTEYTETPLGEIPKIWKTSNLHNLVKIIDCKHYTPEYVEEGIPIIRTNDIKSKYLKFEGVNYVSEESYKDLTSRHIPRRGDIVYSREGTFGVASLVTTDDLFCIGQRVVILTPKDVNPHFLFFMLNSQIVYNQVLRSSLGTTARRINVKEIQTLKIPTPQIKEQNEISSILHIQENALLFEEKKKTSLIEIKKGLIQLLLSGKIRVELKGDGLHRIRDSREANN